MRMDNMVSLIVRHIETLSDITEQKIQAVIARDSNTLISLLQQEIDPLTILGQRVMEASQLLPEQRRLIRSKLEYWASRERYLAEMVETHMGYVDFILELLGDNHPPSIDYGL